MPRLQLASNWLLCLLAARATIADALASDCDGAGGRHAESPALDHKDFAFPWPHFPLGNTLMAYWNARATAACLEEAFAARAIDQPLLQKLRSHVPHQTLTPSMRSKCDLLEEIGREAPGAVCWHCGYPHGVAYAPWRLFTDVILEETRALVQRFDVHPLARDPHTVTVHIRCDDYILKFHQNYGLLRHQFYNRFIRNDTRRVLLLSTPETLGLDANASYCAVRPEATRPKCTQGVFDFKAFLEGAHPHVAVQIGCVSDSDVGDWLFLASARTVVLSPSTFSFTATLGNPNTVVFPVTAPAVISQNGNRTSAWPTFARFHTREAELLGGMDIAGMDGDDVIGWLKEGGL